MYKKLFFSLALAATSSISAQATLHTIDFTPSEIQEVVEKTESLAAQPDIDPVYVNTTMAQFCLDKFRETHNTRFYDLGLWFLNEAKKIQALEDEHTEQIDTAICTQQE